MGGLGNQMFQYSFYKSLLEKGIEAKLDISQYKYYRQHNGYELEKVFGVKPVYASINECRNLGAPSGDVFSKIKRKLGIAKRSNNLIEENIEQSIKFNNNYYDICNDTYIIGYYSSYKYFDSIKDLIKKDFIFKNIKKVNINISKEIEKANSVSVHVRLGDYKKYAIYQDVCTSDYYTNAMNYICERYENIKFYIFSNDIAYCKNIFDKVHNIEYIDWNYGDCSYEDMRLMSLCKYNIIANSTFSFWGAYLNNNKQKVVICPKKFLNLDIYQEDIFPKDWIRI